MTPGGSSAGTAVRDLAPVPGFAGLAAPDERQYLVSRWRGDEMVVELKYLSHLRMTELVVLVWGIVPRAIEDGIEIHEEQRFHLGGPDWLVVRRYR